MQLKSRRARLNRNSRNRGRVRRLRKKHTVTKPKLASVKKRLSKKCKSEQWIKPNRHFSAPVECEFIANKCVCWSDDGSSHDAPEFYKALKKEFGHDVYNDKTGKINYDYIKSL